MTLSPTDAAQDVADAALSALELGHDLTRVGKMAGLLDVGDDDEGRLLYAHRTLPLQIEVDEDSLRIQWVGDSAEDCSDAFLALLADYDADARCGAEDHGGRVSGSLHVGGRDFAFVLHDDAVPLGPNDALVGGTVLVLVDEEAEERFGTQRAFG